MKDLRALYVTSREGWRAWLEEHHDREAEIWLIYYKQHTKKPRIPYEDAVEEALCFGWIDSIVRRLDDDRFAQKFTPRKADSKWSDLNRQRYARLLAAGRITPAGLARAPGDKSPDSRSESGGSGAEIPGYIEEALKRQPRAWENFQGLAPSYRRLYVGWIEAAKKGETRIRRLEEATTLLLQNKKLGLK